MRFSTISPRTFVLMIIALALTCYWGRELLIWLNYSDRVRIWFVRTVAVLGLLAVGYVCVKRVARGRYRIATLVFGLPTIAAVAMLPLSYFTNARSVRMQLARTGVFHRVEATDLEAKLNWFARAFLGDGNSQLFSSRIVTVSLDLRTFDSVQLKNMPAIRNAQFIVVGMPPNSEQIPQELLLWFDTLSRNCRVYMVLTSIPELDPEVTTVLRRNVDILGFSNLSLNADQLRAFAQASIPSYQFHSVVFSGENWDTVVAPTPCERVDFRDCQVRPDQVLVIASKLKCEKISLRQTSLKPAIVWAEDEIQKFHELQHIKSIAISP